MVFDQPSVDEPSAWPIVLWPIVLDQPSFDQVRPTVHITWDSYCAGTLSKLFALNCSAIPLQLVAVAMCTSGTLEKGNIRGSISWIVFCHVAVRYFAFIHCKMKWYTLVNKALTRGKICWKIFEKIATELSPRLYNWVGNVLCILSSLTSQGQSNLVPVANKLIALVPKKCSTHTLQLHWGRMASLCLDEGVRVNGRRRRRRALVAIINQRPVRTQKIHDIKSLRWKHWNG